MRALPGGQDLDRVKKSYSSRKERGAACVSFAGTGRILVRVDGQDVLMGCPECSGWEELEVVLAGEPLLVELGEVLED